MKSLKPILHSVITLIFLGIDETPLHEMINPWLSDEELDEEEQSICQEIRFNTKKMMLMVKYGPKEDEPHGILFFDFINQKGGDDHDFNGDDFEYIKDEWANNCIIH